MEKVLSELCAELNNYFWRQKKTGEFTIRGGRIDLDGYIQNGQYFRILGSVFNDGVHKYPASSLHNEEFRGSVWSMAVPETVLDLASDISDWQKKYGVDSPAFSPFQSESFNNYSYSKSSGGGSSGDGDSSNSWQGVFASRLNKWRRVRGLD